MVFSNQSMRVGQKSRGLIETFGTRRRKAREAIAISGTHGQKAQEVKKIERGFAVLPWQR